MKLEFEEKGVQFESEPQNARVWSEAWVGRNLFCANCGHERLSKIPNNSPVADVRCSSCDEEFEIKCQKSKFGARVVDGAYKTMLERLRSNNNPSLVLMRYDRARLSVVDLCLIPKHFFTSNFVQARPPLASTARRAGWVGCNILLDQIPDAGKIYAIRNGIIVSRNEVIERWRKTKFLLPLAVEARGWLLATLKCVEAIGKAEFTLSEVYAFEDRLKTKFPENKHVREKLRQ